MKYAMIVIAALNIGFVALIAAQDAPALSEVEQLKIQIVELQRQVAIATEEADRCRAQIWPLRRNANIENLEAAERQLKDEIEKGHTGFVYQNGTLVKAPPIPPDQATAPPE